MKKWKIYKIIYLGDLETSQKYDLNFKSGDIIYIGRTSHKLELRAKRKYLRIPKEILNSSTFELIREIGDDEKYLGMDAHNFELHTIRMLKELGMNLLNVIDGIPKPTKPFKSGITTPERREKWNIYQRMKARERRMTEEAKEYDRKYRSENKWKIKMRNLQIEKKTNKIE